MSAFAFSLNQNITLAMSGEKGVVIGRAEYVEGVERYLVRYVNGNGSQVEEWLTPSAISAASA